MSNNLQITKQGREKMKNIMLTEGLYLAHDLEDANLFLEIFDQIDLKWIESQSFEEKGAKFKENLKTLYKHAYLPIFKTKS